MTWLPAAVMVAGFAVWALALAERELGRRRRVRRQLRLIERWPV